MTNTEIAEHFLLLAQLMEIQGENPFKIKSYSYAADVIEEYPRELIAIEDSELYQIKGIGQAVGEKVRELQHSGRMQALQTILEATPPGIVEMLQVKGLSPKKISTLWKVLGADTIDLIEKAALENRIAPVKGFGAKTQETIRAAIAFYKKSLGSFLWAKAEVMMLATLQSLEASFPAKRFEPVGSMRRQLDTVETIDILCDLAQADLLNFLSNIPEGSIEYKDEFSLHIRISAQPLYCFHLATQEDYYYQLFVKTGHNDFVTPFLERYTVSPTAASE
jgi:DNA polymerase (family 10)